MELRESTRKKTLQVQTKLKVKQTTIEDSLHNQTNNLEKKTPLGHILEDSREQEEFAPLISSVINMATSDKIENKLDFIIQRIGEVETNLTKRIDELSSRITNTERDIVKLDRKVQDAKALANGTNFELNKLKDTVAQQKKAISMLERDLDDVQGRIRRKTLIFRGIPEGLEKPGGWKHCKKLILQFLRDHFRICHNVEIERAHRSPSYIKPHSTGPRPIIVAFLRWEDTNHILSLAPKVLRENPLQLETETPDSCQASRQAEVEGAEQSRRKKSAYIYIDQMYSPKITLLRQKALQKRKELIKENPSWVITLKYPPRIFVKKHENDRYNLYRWSAEGDGSNE